MYFKNRRAWIAQTAAAAALATVCAVIPAQAQDYPNRTVKIVVPFSAGGGGDAIGRLVARKLADQFKQSVIVENKPGASSIIATDLVAKSAPDGYTILLNVPLVVQAVSLFNKLPYDPLTDLEPVNLLGTTQVYLAVGTSKVTAKTMKEYVEQARQHPKEYGYASIGPGSTGHLLGFALNEANKLACHLVEHSDFLVICQHGTHWTVLWLRCCGLECVGASSITVNNNAASSNSDTLK